MKSTFNYYNAFSRNLGYLSKDEQQAISEAKIAVIGLGGVGGNHLHCLCRLGFQNFHIADLDHFEEHNFNRQFGATTETIGVDKIKVAADIVKTINPDSKVKCFNEGVTESNIDEFLDGTDYLIDGVDLYEINIREKIFNRANELNIPVITAAPLGMGTSYMVFSPDKPDLTTLACFKEGDSDLVKIVKFLALVAPKLMHVKYFAHRNELDFKQKKMSSLSSGCYAASAALSSALLKLVLKRGKTMYAPGGFQTDFFQNKTKKFYNPLGNKNFIAKLRIKALCKILDVN